MTNEEILLQAERERLLREARALTDNPSATKQDLKRADVLLAQASSLKTNHERQVRLAAAMDVPIEKFTKENSLNLRRYLAQGREARTYTGMSIATDSNGGFLVPETFFTKVTNALKQADGLWNDDVITRYEDAHGNQLACPLVDDTAAVAVQVAENILSDENEIGLINRLLLDKANTWRSKKLLASLELVQDVAFPLEDALIVPSITRRFQRGIGAANVATLISSTTSGATSATNNVVGLDDTLNLLQSVDPAYLNQPKTFFGMNFSTLIGLLKLKDSNGRYQWNPRTDANGRMLLHNIPVVLMPSLPNATPGAQGSVVLGDFSRCLLRIVKDSMKVQRYEEAPGVVENFAIAYEGFVSTSFGVLTSSGSDSPIKFLTQASS